jgi:hypothetical protein
MFKVPSKTWGTSMWVEILDFRLYLDLRYSKFYFPNYGGRLVSEGTSSRKSLLFDGAGQHTQLRKTISIQGRAVERHQNITIKYIHI